MKVFIVLLSLAIASMAQIVKPGHDQIKEYHFHPYWLQNNPQQGNSTNQLFPLIYRYSNIRPTYFSLASTDLEGQDR